MSSVRSSVPGTPFAVAAFVLVLALYVPYFFLQVESGFWGSTINGWEAFMFIVCYPLLWTFLLGHVALWVGAVFLLARRWTRVWACGGVALLSSLLSSLLILGGDFYVGTLMKLLSMSVLTAAGVVGALHCNRLHENHADRTAPAETRG